MKVAGIQMDVVYGNPDENYRRAEELIRAAVKDKPETVVLPETWNTGFPPTERTKELADRDGHRTKELFASLARELEINIVGGSITNLKGKGGSLYNTCYTFNKKGECVVEYDKTHLFSYAKEHEYFQAGDRVTTFELDGVKCGVIICYDIRFLELVRTLALQEIEVLFVPAQWPVPRINHWEILNQARAIENQMYVVCVNSCGVAGETAYGGHSAIINPWGEVLAKAGDKDEIITAELDFGIVERLRNSINVYRDRRPELYNIK